MTAADDSPHTLPAASALRRSRRRWRIFAIVLLIIAVAAIGLRFAAVEHPLGDRIARVEINGTIQSDRDRTRMLENLGDDPAVKAVIVSINSPGGTTAGGEELYTALRALAAKKPTVSVIGELGASAAYMTAIATDRIFARSLSLVGSIGVLYEHYDVSKLLNTVGIAIDKVVSAPLKGEPDFDKPMSPEVRASLQAVIDDFFAWFVDRVSERRGIDRPTTLGLSDGRIYSGHMALDDKLIDAIGGEDDAQHWLEASKGVPTGLRIVTQKPDGRDGFDFGGMFGSFAKQVLGFDRPMVLDGLVSLWQADAAS